MRALYATTVLLAICIHGLPVIAHAAPYVPQNSNRVEIELDTGWLYNPSDVSNGQSTSLNESGWTRVCVPHANVITKHAFQSESAFRFISWYRKHFTPPASQNGRRFYLEFEGVSINATVYVNGQQAGSHRGGYTPFTIDITDRVTTGQDNLIAVRVDSRQQSSVPPEGGRLDFMIYGGMVRPVNLIVTDPLHVEWVFASTQNPSQSAPSNPTVNVKTRIVNNSGSAKTCALVTSVVDRSNTVVATVSSSQSVPANGSYVFNQTTPALSNPTLWDIHNPYLYTVYSQVRDGSTYVDEYTERIGIRSITMNRTSGGFYLNGRVLKLFGLNRHETYPYIGRAAPRRLQRKDADILKYELGCNTVRTSHYPQAPDFLDRCDEIGLLVLEEVPGWMHIGDAAWKNLEREVLVDMIVRDRNHPSIFTWGVRVNESPDDNAFYRTMNDSARALDPTRLTCGVRRSNSDPATSFLEDIWTQNFLGPSSNPPNMPVITTEVIGHGFPVNSFSREDSLVDLIIHHANAQNQSFAQSKWGGMLGWCAFDYASSHDNAVVNNAGRYVSNHGMADVFRILKFAGYLYQSQRDPSRYGPMVHICNYWRSGSPKPVYVTSNCDQVELFVNGSSVGRTTPSQYTSLPHSFFQFNASWSSGNLRADGYIGGSKVASHTWHTPGAPTKITLTPDTSTIFENGDMTRVVIMVGDANNPFVPYNTASVTISVTGAGDFIGESPIAMENGVSAFYVRSRAGQTGTITSNASASGLPTASCVITVIKKPGDVTGIQPARTPYASTHLEKPWRRIFPYQRFSAPAWAGNNATISVYDISGKLLLKKDMECRSIDCTKLGLARKVHIVEITKRTTNNGTK
ncbi:MAG: DUF4982 domain-containing protein [Chitinispirillaceae bacterium]|nr:DUF4982 domain-containing protein [Chitinispirillaceae bacterium]